MSTNSPRRSRRRRLSASEQQHEDIHEPKTAKNEDIPEQEQQYEQEQQQPEETTITVVTVQADDHESLTPIGQPNNVQVTSVTSHVIHENPEHPPDKVDETPETAEVEDEEDVEDEDGSDLEPEGGAASKWRMKYDQNRKYRPEWEERFPWLTRESKDSQMGLCVHCHKVVRPRIYDLEKHGRTLAHTKLVGKLDWEKKQRIILEAKPAPMVNPRHHLAMGEEERVRNIILGVKESQMAMKRIKSSSSSSLEQQQQLLEQQEQVRGGGFRSRSRLKFLELLLCESYFLIYGGLRFPRKKVMFGRLVGLFHDPFCFVGLR